MTLKTINAKDAASLDKDLMEEGAFSLDQLMELAGLSVSQAVYKVHPPSKGRNILVACGPGNNGGDGLVAARHLAHYGYKPTVYYPKQGKNELYERLKTQLHTLSIPIITTTTTTPTTLPTTLATTDLIIDAIFGFSFSGPLRDPFPSLITTFETTHIPILSIDAPSSWDIESGPPKEGPGAKFMPQTLVSLTAPKPLVRWYRGRHFLGGRFLTQGVAERYGLVVPEYPGVEQVVEVGVEGEGEGEEGGRL
ncbi:hypothetical protein FQN50_007545 [Emmonsiellopsis sp. PD_5]|nr:hypothetical protein FQN50_007545 [Emmonsiellopsis sp. PD_5]